MSGYFEVGVYHVKSECNIGTLWRSAYQLGAAGVFTIGKRYRRQSSDTLKTPANIPLRHYKTWDEFSIARPIGATLVGVEMDGEPLNDFLHPPQAVYLLGAEDHGLPDEIRDKCNGIVSLDSVRVPSYNVAVAGSIVLYHRVFLSGVKK